MLLDYLVGLYLTQLVRTSDMYLDKTSGGLNPRGQQPQSNLQISTVRSFEGGLNVSDTDLNMSAKFAKVLDNVERAPDGSLSIRPGTVLFSNTLASGTDVVNHVYFAGHVISVQTDGSFTLVNAAGVGTPMLNGGGNLWTPGIEFVSFTIFNSDLIVCNGRDKPIIVSGDPLNANYLVIQYLIDLAELHNINTPIGKFVCAHGQYTCIAGVSSDPSTLFISAQGTSGTYFGDAAPNDAVNIDLGPRVSLGSSTITGMVAYRDKLLVTFERGILPLNLGVYTGSGTDGGVHTPSDDGFIEEFGCLAHRSLISVGDDTFFNDNVGVNSITRITTFNTLRPVRVSHLIDPLTTELLQPLTLAEIDKYVFSVYDLRNFRYMLFIPQFDAGGNLIETVGFSYTNIPTLKIQAWSRLRGWRWQSACRTALQNIIFSMGNKLYAYDFDGQGANADFLNDTTFEGGAGVPITFVWEMPWADMKHRMDIKATRYLAMDTQGDGHFTVETYVDNFIYDRQGNRAPLLSCDFVGGDSGGYGNSPYGNSPYGGGRNTGDERLFAWVAKFKLIKLRFYGVTKSRLRFISVSLAFLHGSIRR